MTKCSWKYVFGLFIGLLFMSAVGEAFATEGANAATEKKVETFVGATKLGDKKDQDVIDQVKQNCADAKKKVEDKEKEISDIDVKINRPVTTSAVGTSVTGFVMTATTKINDPEAYNKYTAFKVLGNPWHKEDDDDKM